MKILLADDEKDLTYALAAILQKNRFTVDISYDGKMAFELARDNAYDCLVLDVMMPRMDGFRCLKALRTEHIDTPVIFLSAKTAVEDRVRGLEAGADDYIGKPFDSTELLARIRAVVRRHSKQSANEVTFGDLSLDIATGTLSSNGKSASLSNRELQILSLFFLHPDRRYGSEAILSAITDEYNDTDIGAVWVYINALRKILKSLDCHVKISLSRGIGYRLEEIEGV